MVKSHNKGAPFLVLKRKFIQEKLKKVDVDLGCIYLPWLKILQTDKVKGNKEVNYETSRCINPCLNRTTVRRD